MKTTSWQPVPLFIAGAELTDHAVVPKLDRGPHGDMLAPVRSSLDPSADGIEDGLQGPLVVIAARRLRHGESPSGLGGVPNQESPTKVPSPSNHGLEARTTSKGWRRSNQRRQKTQRTVQSLSITDGEATTLDLARRWRRRCAQRSLNRSGTRLACS